MKNFNDVYEKIYVQWQPRLEQLRNEAKKETIIKITMLIVGFFSCIFGMMNENFISVIFGIFVLIISLLIFHKRNSTYNNEFKDKVITAIVKSYTDNLSYSPNSGISSVTYIDGEFERFDRYKSEDGIRGELEHGYKINMSEVHTEDRYTDSDGNTHYTTLFHGLFAKVEIDKYIPTKIRIRKNTIKFFDNEERIEMDSGEFEKMYDIYSSNKIVAMQLFTSDLLQMFVDFKDIKPELTIKGNLIYIRFETGNVFEANIFQDALDYKTLKRYYDIIGFVLKLAEIMKKNIKETEI